MAWKVSPNVSALQLLSCLDSPVLSFLSRGHQMPSPGPFCGRAYAAIAAPGTVPLPQ